MAAKKRRGGRRNANANANANSYAALVSPPGAARGPAPDGEMNAHLAERFSAHAPASRQHARGAESHQRPPAVPKTNLNMHTPRVHEYFKTGTKPVVGGNWLDKPEMPTPSEIMPEIMGGSSSDPKLVDLTAEIRPNKVEGAYNSNEEYLETHYNLLREDSIRPLREAVDQVRESPFLDESEYGNGNGGSNIGLYEPVYLTSVVFSPRGLATRVAFSLSRVKKFVRWEQSKRLITGTLVALSPADDMFQTKCVVATVAARPLSSLSQNPPEIDLFFARPQDMEIDPTKKWVMVESRSSFFEASRHTLLALQHMMREPFPLSEHLVNAQKHVEPPKYKLQNPHTDMSSLVAMEEEDAFKNVNILVDSEWPQNTSHGLDKSQSHALRRILTSRLAIVQGPPGTGKTYVSVVALKILLSNMGPNDPPIIVTCQTNHALDQLLRHVAEFEPNFIRLGGRSKDTDKIKKRTLHEVRKSQYQQFGPDNSGPRPKSLRDITKKMMMLLSPLESNQPPLDHRVLARLGIMTKQHAESLEMGPCAMGISPDTPGIQMEQWLGKRLTNCSGDRPIHPDDFDMEFEEEDFEVEKLQELEAEAVAQDDDFESLKGPYTLLHDNWKGIISSYRSDDEIRAILRKTVDLNTIPVSDRGNIYNYFQHEAKRIIGLEFRSQAVRYQQFAQQRKIDHWEADSKILRDQRLIGMTTTGLSKYRGLIASLNSKILLVEEAAETLEAPVAAGCLPSLEHLILVGDHQQLRPHCQVRELEDDPFNFNLSLFERMVLNDVELDCLKTQRRMIPEIRELLRPIYGNLKDHPSVKDVSNRRPVEGMGGCNSFFFTHEWPEARDGNMSATNEKEAAMIVGFFDYLVLNGVDPSRITVLTFYNGQRKTIAKMLRQHPNLRGLNHIVVTVDSYQGEENDIVLLSLVRSNTKHIIGFLDVDNRVCVALSRAKRGFYVFGNAEMLAIKSAIWAEVVDIMYGKTKSSNPDKRRRLGYHLPLQCSNHEHKMFVQQPEDWDLINGGCDDRCGCRLPCGHTCMLRCHPFDNNLINCTQKCSKRIQSCNHPCAALCCDPCKCVFCDRNHDGQRAMLRVMNGTRALKPSLQQNLIQMHNTGPDLLDEPSPVTAKGTHTHTQQPSPAEHPDLLLDSTDFSGSSAEQWNDFAEGGVQAEDAEVARKIRQENLDFVEKQKLKAKDGVVTGSPGKKPVKLINDSASTNKAPSSKDSDLLIDVAEKSPTTKETMDGKDVLGMGMLIDFGEETPRQPLFPTTANATRLRNPSADISSSVDMSLLLD